MTAKTDRTIREPETVEQILRRWAFVARPEVRRVKRLIDDGEYETPARMRQTAERVAEVIER
jgi:hypothetical protein